MSDLVEKTIGTFSSLFSNVGLLNSNDSKHKIRSTCDLDKSHFYAKLRSASTKKERDVVITSFLTSAEKLLSGPNLSESQVETCVHLALCCEALGHRAQFVYVHAIKLAQKGNLSQKHTGYLAAASLLHPQHELTILLINSIQKDLESSNYAEVMLGLTSVCNVINSETVHNVFYLVQEKLQHRRVEVRKLAVSAVDSCLRLTNSESAYKMALPKLEKVLSDSDLGVVSAAIPVVHNVVLNCPGEYSYLIDCLIQIQNQLLLRRNPRHMDYQSIPAPWLQIKIIKFFSLLCKNSEQAEKVFPVLKTTLQKAELNHNMAYAIIAEVIETIAALESDQEMIQLALSSATKFLNSDDGNLKYVGVQAFTKIIQKMKPTLDSTHQESIILCLNHPDDALKKKTLELLYNLANPSNAQAVCKKLIEFMVSSGDEHAKKDVGLKALEIANQFNVDDSWYIATVNTVLLDVGNVISQEKVCEVINVILQDTTGARKSVAKKAYFDMCQRIHPPTCIVKIICSIFDNLYELEEVLPNLLEKADDTSCMWLLISLRNKLLITKEIPGHLKSIIKQKTFSTKILQQIKSEILKLMEAIDKWRDLTFTKEMDPTLSFLDEYVCNALLQGKPAYRPRRLRVDDFPAQVAQLSASLSPVGSEMSSSIQDPNRIKPSSDLMTHSYGSLSSSSLSTLSQDVPYMPKKRVWTKEGRVDEEQNKPEKTQPTPQDAVDQLFAGLR